MNEIPTPSGGIQSQTVGVQPQYPGTEQGQVYPKQHYPYNPNLAANTPTYPAYPAHPAYPTYPAYPPMGYPPSGPSPTGPSPSGPSPMYPDQPPPYPGLSDQYNAQKPPGAYP